MDLRRLSVYVRSILGVALIIIYNLRNIMPNPLMYILNTPIFYIFVLFAISYLVTMNPTQSLAIAILIAVLTISNKSTPLKSLQEGFQTEAEAIQEAIKMLEPYRQDAGEANVKDVVQSFTPNIRNHLKDTRFEIPNEVDQQMRTIDFCNRPENADKGICKWFSTLQADPSRPDIQPVTTETRLNEIFRQKGVVTETTTDGVTIDEGFYNFDMSCDSCGTNAQKPPKRDCPTTMRDLAIGNIEAADGMESDFTSSYAPVHF